MWAGLGLLALLLLGSGCGEVREESAAADADALERLASLGYVDWSDPLPDDALARSGVVHATPAAYPGYNLYTSLPSRSALLVDMGGRVVHTWTAPDDRGRAWHHVEMTPEGALLGVDGGPLDKLDWGSRVLWQAPFRAHHDLDVAPDGTIHALGLQVRRLGDADVPILDDEIVVVGSDGRVARTIPFSRVFAGVLPPRKLSQIQTYLRRTRLLEASEEELIGKRGDPGPDVFHANSIELLRRDVPGLGRAGDALVSMRSLDRVAVIDLDREQVTWSWGPHVLDRPHHATLLPNGRVSVFDNGWRRERSRVVHLDPLRGIRWQYPVTMTEDFFTQRRGAAQHLPNGNVLITESQDGRVLEVDPAGEIVWEFLNPEVDPETRQRARIYRMERIEAHVVEPLLARAHERARPAGPPGPSHPAGG